MEKIKDNLNFNTLEDKLTNNRMRLYGHILRMNEERILNYVLNMKVKGKHLKGRLKSRWD
jgi:hypothetical protein